MHNPYLLNKPTEAQLLAQLQKAIPDEKPETIVQEAESALAMHCFANPLICLVRVTLWLSRQNGLRKIVGQSMLIRLKFYYSLSGLVT